jgi:hypothetical protein
LVSLADANATLGLLDPEIVDAVQIDIRNAGRVVASRFGWIQDLQQFSGMRLK